MGSILVYTSFEIKMSTCICLYFHHPFLHHKAWWGIEQIFGTIAEPDGQKELLSQCPDVRIALSLSKFWFVVCRSYCSRKQFVFLVYSGAGEHKAPVRFSGRPHAELYSTEHIDYPWLQHPVMFQCFSSVLWGYFCCIFSAYSQCILPILVEAQGVSI